VQGADEIGDWRVGRSVRVFVNASPC